MLPKIKFVYSFPYNQLFVKDDNEEKNLKEINEFINKIRSRWYEIGEKVLKKIEEIGFFWKVENIPCFVVKNFPVSGISMPLTIKVSKNIDFAIYTLTHELIHINFFKEEKYNDILNLLQKKYKEKLITIRHIIVYSALRMVIINIFGDKFFIKMYETEKEKIKNSNYKKAIEIFEELYPKLKEGNIIESFKNYLEQIHTSKVE